MVASAEVSEVPVIVVTEEQEQLPTAEPGQEQHPTAEPEQEQLLTAESNQQVLIAGPEQDLLPTAE